MKRYKVYVYNTVDKFWDCYEVLAEDPVDARNVAVQRLIDETGHGLDVYEVTDVCEIKDQGGLNDERETLKPCPFCGQEHTTITESNTEGIRIRCPKCNITFTRDFYEHRGELGRQRTIEAWNTRSE